MGVMLRCEDCVEEVGPHGCGLNIDIDTDINIDTDIDI